jgi:hypothetical protein
MLPLERDLRPVNTYIRAIGALGLSVAAGCATGTGPANAHFFLERSYAGPVPTDTTIQYEGQAAAHILVLDNLAGAFEEISQNADKAMSGALRIIITPMFRIRQLNDSSSAVRTPSFMPRASVEYLVAKRLSDASGPPSNLRFSPVLVGGGRLTIAHHSNGQAGCFRDGFQPVDRHADVCVPRAGVDTTVVRLNRANGDFSNSFVQGMVHGTVMNRAAGGKPTHSFGLAAALDYHPSGIVGALSDEQRELYGGWRLRGFAEAMQVVGNDCEDGEPRSRFWEAACFFRGKARVSAEYERAPENPGPLARRVSPAILPWRAQVELSYAIAPLLGTGLFVRWHDGQDYYNIGFVNQRRVFMWGVMLDGSALPRIGPRIVQ